MNSIKSWGENITNCISVLLHTKRHNGELRLVCGGVTKCITTLSIETQSDTMVGCVVIDIAVV